MIISKWLKNLGGKRQKPPAGFADRIGSEAEALYRTGRYHCAEAVLEVIRIHFRPDVPADVVQLVSGFGAGSGSGCICGAVSGGTVAIGLAMRGDKRRTAVLTKNLHAWFREEYGATCCKTVRASGKGHCPVLTGNVAGRVAEMLMEEGVCSIGEGAET